MFEVKQKEITNGVKHQITIKGKNGHLKIILIKKGKKLYIFKVAGTNAGAYFKTTTKEINKLAKKLGCNLITSDIHSDNRQKLPRIALIAGFAVSPRSYFGMMHGDKFTNTKTKLNGTHLAMHKRVK
ncbi:MAG: hypothetical protein WCI04_05720 [archaeon]